MKNKSWFNKDLYIEGLRTLKVLGGILLTFIVLFSILYPMNLFAMDESSQYIAQNAFSRYSTQMTFLFYLIIVITVPILTLRTFTFYNTRNGSDFFQAIPHKKQCLFLSYAAAALTWIVACTLIPGIVSYLLYVFIGYTPIGIASFLIIELHILVAALLVMSAICLACSITGTLLTNILTTGIILFWPRCFIAIMRLTLTDLTNNFIPYNGFWFGTKANLVVDSVICIEDNISHLFDIAPMVYTLVLALLYLVLATFLFMRRPSEIANRPTLGKRMQAVICILIGLAVSIIPVIGITSIIFGEYYDLSTIMGIITFYVIAVLAMVVYELLTTKKVKNLLSIIPRGICLLILNVIIIIGLCLSKQWVMGYTPDASDISYVSCPNLYEITNYYQASYSSDYIDARLGEYQSDNEELKQIVADALKNFDTYYGNDSYSIVVKFKSGALTHTRMIYVPYKNYDRIKEILSADKEFCSIFTNIPSANKNSFYLSNSYYSITNSLSQEQLLELYNMAKEEIASYDPLEWAKSCIYDNGETYLTLSFTVDSVTQYQRYSIPINKNLPKTFNKCIELINSSCEYSISDYLESEQFKNGNSLTVSTSNTDEYYLYSYIYNENLTTAEIASFVKLLQENENKTLDMTDSDSTLLQISFYMYDEDENYQDVVKYISIPTSEFTKVRSYFE